MRVRTNITFGGRCVEALEFYKKTLGARITGLMRWKENFDKDMKRPPGYLEISMTMPNMWSCSNSYLAPRSLGWRHFLI
jgi:hypothetical protein